MIVVCVSERMWRIQKKKKKQLVCQNEISPLNNSLTDRSVKAFIMAPSWEAGGQGECSQGFSPPEKQCTVSLGGQQCNYSRRIQIYRSLAGSQTGRNVLLLASFGSEINGNAVTVEPCAHNKNEGACCEKWFYSFAVSIIFY